MVLRKQVPIRFDEEARSWLGGLPRMPIGTEWPRASARKPLNFVAQIDCSALPPDLWGGLGPRTGWLLLFVDFDDIDGQYNRKIARVLHVPELGPEADPPKGMYFAHRDMTDVSGLPRTPANVLRPHFRKWPIDLVTTGADTSEQTGAELYGAPENDLIIGAYNSHAGDRPLTWRGAYLVLAGLVLKHTSAGYENNWTGNSGGLLDYPEPDASERNKEWQQRRERIAAQMPRGYHCPEFYEADQQLKLEIYEERRKGWTHRAFPVLDEEEERCRSYLADKQAKLAAAMAAGDENEAFALRQLVEAGEEDVARNRAHRAYLTELFAQYPSEEAFVEEINRVGRAHLQWAQQTAVRLQELLAKAASQDLDAPIAAADWDAIVAEIATMKSTYWIKTHQTDLLKKVEREIGRAHV